MYNKNGVDWDYYSNERVENINDKYLPVRGEGETMASQLVTAINKLIYKYYNDGDIYDNTYLLEGWCNDLSSYANWIYTHYRESRDILDKIKICPYNDYDMYEHILKDLSDTFFIDEFLESENEKPIIGSIYDCNIPFQYIADED